MDRNVKLLTGPNGEKGQVAALAAVMMVGLLGIAALAVDLGYFFVTRNELQNAADGAALAGTRTLGHIYQGLPYEVQQGYVCDGGCADAIRDVAQDVATSNKAGGVMMTVLVEDVAIGYWDGDAFTESTTMITPDAVQVITRRDEVANGPVTTFFARVLGIESGSVTAIATAALTGQSTKALGEIELPIGISSWFFDPVNLPFCNEDIQFYPTNDPTSCAGWTSWEYGSNDVTLRHMLDEDEGYSSPETIAGETIFNFTGGTLSNPTFDALLTLFQIKGFDVDASWEYLLDEDGNPMHQAPSDFDGVVPLMVLDHEGFEVRAEYPDGTLRNLHKWETAVPVYDRDDCSNPNQSIKIVGFAPIELRDVLNSPDKLVRGKVKCDYVDPLDSRGGGGEYGIKGSIPGLVR